MKSLFALYGLNYTTSVLRVAPLLPADSCSSWRSARPAVYLGWLLLSLLPGRIADVPSAASTTSLRVLSCYYLVQRLSVEYDMWCVTTSRHQTLNAFVVGGRTV